jgi:hypothetical protein
MILSRSGARSPATGPSSRAAIPATCGVRLSSLLRAACSRSVEIETLTAFLAPTGIQTTSIGSESPRDAIRPDGCQDSELVPEKISTTSYIPGSNFAASAGGLVPGNIDYQLTKMTLLGHMRKRLKSLVECKFAIHHRGDPVLLDETIHAFEMFA